MNFKEWISLSESKGIRLTDEIRMQLESLMERIHRTALRVKEEPFSAFLVGFIEYEDIYFRRKLMQWKIPISIIKPKIKKVPLWVINNPEDPAAGFYGPYEYLRPPFNRQQNLALNVGQTEKKNITPTWIKEILIHEIIHSMDPKVNWPELRGRQKPYDTSSPELYFGHPTEFDAFSGALVARIIEAGRRSKGTYLEPFVKKLLDDTLQFLTNPKKAESEHVYGFFGDPNTYRLYHVYKKAGTRSQQRKFKQRIFNAVKSSQDLLNTT